MSALSPEMVHELAYLVWTIAVLVTAFRTGPTLR